MPRLFTFLFLAAVAAAAPADAPEGYPFQRFDQALRQAGESGRPVFVYFGRYGCGYCEKTNKEAFSDPGVRERYVEHYELAYVDAESGRRLRLPSGERITERELGTRYDAFVTPVFTYLTPDGEKIGRLIGLQSVDTLLAADERAQKVLQGSKAR